MRRSPKMRARTREQTGDEEPETSLLATAGASVVTAGAPVAAVGTGAAVGASVVTAGAPVAALGTGAAVGATTGASV